MTSRHDFDPFDNPPNEREERRGHVRGRTARIDHAAASNPVQDGRSTRQTTRTTTPAVVRPLACLESHQRVLTEVHDVLRGVVESVLILESLLLKTLHRVRDELGVEADQGAAVINLDEELTGRGLKPSA